MSGTGAIRQLSLAWHLSRRQEYRPCAILSYCRKRIEDPHRTSSQLALRRIGIDDPGVVPRVDQLRPADYDGAMSKAPPKFENSNIARLRRRIIAAKGKLASEARNALQIALCVAVQIPIGRIKRYLYVPNDTSLFVDLGEQGQAVCTGAFDARHVMIRCAEPFSRFLDNRKPPSIIGADRGLRPGEGESQTAVSGVGINGKPPKFAALLKTFVQVASVRSQPGNRWN